MTEGINKYIGEAQSQKFKPRPFRHKPLQVKITSVSYILNKLHDQNFVSFI